MSPERISRPSGPPVRHVYTPASLEAWLRKMNAPWEKHFSRSALATGRRLYLSSCLVELELAEKSAIMVFRIGTGKACYAVVDWEERKPALRSSTENDTLGEALAVAGFYGIEELLAEELPPLPPEAAKAAPVEVQQPAPEPAPRRPGPPPVPSKTLIASLDACPGGLLLQILRENPTTGARQNTFTEKPAGSDPEREKMIRLLSLVHRAKFRLLQRKNGYILDDPRRILPFLKSDLGVWRGHVRVELSPGAQVYLKGERRLRAHAFAKAASTPGRFTLEWSFRLEGQPIRLDPAALPLLARHQQNHPDDPLPLPGLGLIRLEAASDNAPAWAIAPDSGQASAETLPACLLFSHQPETGAPLEFSPELLAWKESFSKPADFSEKLPKFLRHYQQQGASWLWHCCDHECHPLLADDMGLGKTMQVLSLLSSRPAPDKLSSLVVCPASVIPVWQAEAQKFFPQLSVRLLGPGENPAQQEKPCIWLASYARLRLRREELAKTEFGYVVLDEAQFIRNPDSQAARACFGLKARHRIALTGTPIENRLLDIWSLFHFLMPPLLGPRQQFQERQGRDPEGFPAALARQLAPFTLRRTKEEVLTELPPKTETVLPCPLSTSQQHLYVQLAQEGLKTLDSNLKPDDPQRNIHLLALFTRLRQAACDPALLPGHSHLDTGHSGKIRLLLERLREILDAGHRAVVFSQFVSFLQRIQKAISNTFPEIPLHELTGQTRNRTEAVRRFQEETGPAVFLASLRAAGTGITLHAADYVFLMDPWWNPAVEAQAIDRLHRLGQQKPVFVFRMVAQGTIEDHVNAIRSSRTDLFRNLESEFLSLRAPDGSPLSLASLVSLDGPKEAEVQ